MVPTLEVAAFQEEVVEKTNDLKCGKQLRENGSKKGRLLILQYPLARMIRTEMPSIIGKKPLFTVGLHVLHRFLNYFASISTFPGRNWITNFFSRIKQAISLLENTHLAHGRSLQVLPVHWGVFEFDIPQRKENLPDRVVGRESIVVHHLQCVQ